MQKQPNTLAAFTAATLTAVASLAFAFPAQAQVNPMTAASAPAAAPLTRMQAKMDRDEFLKTHRWDAPTDTWVLKQGVEPPVGVKTRAEVRAARDEFLRNNKWDDLRSGWRPMGGTQRDLSTLSREQVKSDTINFTRTHRWDEQTETWVEKRASAAK